MFRIGFLAAACIALLASCSMTDREPAVRTADPSSQRNTTAGAVVGFAHDADIQAWLGIPLAQPPVGELRWRAPVPPEPWSGVRQALTPNAGCAQLANSMSSAPDAAAGSLVGSEDCLYLDVYAPRATAEAAAARRLPVLLWIHGGGNRAGYAASYDGSGLAGQDLVVVTTNYRLGPFGWFRHPALVAGVADPDDSSGNWGTLDQIRALEWVRENIASFGGDPTNVTVAGESAGGSDVFSLLVSPRAAGLFQRAISQSGGTQTVGLAAAQNLSDAEEPGDANSSSEVALRLLTPAGSDRASAKAALAAMPDAEIARGLRAASVERLLAAYGEGDGATGNASVPMLLRDGHVLPLEESDAALAAGRYNKVPFLVGSNRDEMKLFVMLNPEYTRWWLGVLPRARDAAVSRSIAYHESRGWKVRGVDRPAAAMRAVQGPSVYAYRFDWDESPRVLGVVDLPDLLGAFHGLELGFLFPGLEIGTMQRLFTESNRPGREQLSAAMKSYWANFAYTGDPGRGRDGSLPQWTAWDPTPGGSKYVVLDTEAGGGIRMESAEVTEEVLLSELSSDEHLKDGQRCQLLASLIDRESLPATKRDTIGCEVDVAKGAPGD